MTNGKKHGIRNGDEDDDDESDDQDGEDNAVASGVNAQKKKVSFEAYNKMKVVQLSAADVR